MDISLILLPAGLFAIIFIVQIIRGKSLARRNNARILSITNWLNDALSWILSKSGPYNKSLILSAWIDALNDYALKHTNEVVIHFESIDRDTVVLETKNVLVEPEKGSHNLKFLFDLKIPSLRFKISMKCLTGVDAFPVSLIAEAPVIEGNVTVLVSYEKVPARVDIKFSSIPNIQLTMTHSSKTSEHPIDGDKIIIPLLKQIIASSVVSIPLVLSDPDVTDVEQNGATKLDSTLSPKRRIRTVKRIGADGTTVTATTVTTEKPIYDDSQLSQVPLAVEKVEEELLLTGGPNAASALPTEPGVTELAVRDLLSQPLADVPHKSANQKRLAYTITVTSLQKDPSDGEAQQEEPVQYTDQFEPNSTHDTATRRLSADKQRPIKLVRTLKRRLSFSKKHRRSVSSSDVTPAIGHRTSQGNGGAGDIYQHELPFNEHNSYAGNNSDDNAVTAQKKRRSLSFVSGSVRNLFRRKHEKSLTVDQDALADDPVTLPQAATEQYDSSTFPRQMKAVTSK